MKKSSLTPEELAQQQREGDRRKREGIGGKPRTIAANIHPNPVTQSTATVEYTLTEPRRVAMSMYDMTRKYIHSIYKLDEQAEGTWQEQVELGEMENVLYLLAILIIISDNMALE